LERKANQYSLARQQIKLTKELLEKERKYAEQYHEALLILQKVAATLQQEVHSRIASIVSKCLRILFGDDAYLFEIEFVERRGKTEAILRFTKDGWPVDPLAGAGGGSQDIAAFALRLACISLKFPAPRRVLVLDEPFIGIHKDLHSRVIAMLKVLSDELGFQFILVTHESGLTGGKLYHIED